LKSLALVLAGAFFGFVPTLLILPTGLQAVGALSLAVVIALLLLIGLGVLQNWYHLYNLSSRWKEPLRIGILSDVQWSAANEENHPWTDVEPSAWKSSIETFGRSGGVRVVVETTTTVKSRFDKYAVILNPYGSTYPESDLKTFATLDKITDFVSEGGVFVNVADIPCYYAYSSKLLRKLDTIRPIYLPITTQSGVAIQQVRPFEQSPLPKELGLQILNLDNGQQVDLMLALGRRVLVTFRRATLVERNVEPCTIPVLIPMGDNVTKVAPLFFAKYGEGDVLVSLIWISDSAHTQTEKDAIRDAITRRLIWKLSIKRYTKKA